MWSTSGLTDAEKVMLDLEKGWFKYLGAKHDQILVALKISPTVYYQRLNELIDKPEAMAWDPMTVKRLQRLREARRQQRSASRLHLVDGQGRR